MAAPDSDPHVPSLFAVYPTNDWHERETYDFFGIIFDGHPSLTRIEMPDDWEGHPQRKDYPLGGVPVEYKGAQIPPPDERRALQLMSEHTEDGVARRLVLAARTGTRSSTPPASADPGERIVVNMGPQHPSTHGVLRLILEIEGETVTEVRCGIGYLHTGIEKNLEYRYWTQGVTFVTRMDYLSPFFNETAYCLGVEKLLGITDEIPERANVIRVMMMELNRISSHLVALATGGMELGAMTPMFFGFRGREIDPHVVRVDHRAADEQRLHPARRRGAGPAARRGDARSPKPSSSCASRAARNGRPAQRERHLEGPHPGRRLPGPDRLHGAGHHRADACAPPGCRTTCARPNPTADTRTTSST